MYLTSYCRRNGTYPSILPSETTSRLGEKLPRDCLFPRWVWYPTHCILISQGSRLSDRHVFVPSAQCTEAANKVRRLIFMIRRSFQGLSKSVFTHLYGALVRLHLEYGIPACSPNLVADINHLERLATRLVTGIVTSPTEKDCSDGAFNSCSGDGYGSTWLPLTRYSRVFLMLIRTCVFLPPTRRGLRVHPYMVLQGKSHLRRRELRIVKHRNKLPTLVQLLKLHAIH